MRTDFSLFSDRLGEACRARDMTQDRLCRSIGLGPRRFLNLTAAGPGALDLSRVCQMADALDVSLDWLLGRSKCDLRNGNAGSAGTVEEAKKKAAIAAAELMPI
jgi:transcriptional regulator with XRE-family HTH domain